MIDLAFVLLREPGLPDPAAVVASARSLGVALTADSGADAVTQTYRPR